MKQKKKKKMPKQKKVRNHDSVIELNCNKANGGREEGKSERKTATDKR